MGARTVETLPGLEAPPNAVGRAGARRGRNGDANKLAPEDRPVHDWYRFVLSYPPHLVREYLARFGLGRGHRVLDPFCGTGTTLVECQKHAIASVGIEANVMACMASRVKTNWRPEPDALLEDARRVAEQARQRLLADGIDDHPVLVDQRLPPDRLRGLDRDRADLLLGDSISPLPLHKTLVLLDAMSEHASAEHIHHERAAEGHC